MEQNTRNVARAVVFCESRRGRAPEDALRVARDAVAHLSRDVECAAVLLESIQSDTATGDVPHEAIYREVAGEAGLRVEREAVPNRRGYQRRLVLQR